MIVVMLQSNDELTFLILSGIEESQRKEVLYPSLRKTYYPKSGICRWLLSTHVNRLKSKSGYVVRMDLWCGGWLGESKMSMLVPKALPNWITMQSFYGYVFRSTQDIRRLHSLVIQYETEKRRVAYALSQTCAAALGHDSGKVLVWSSFTEAYLFHLDESASHSS